MTIQWYGHSCFRLESKGLSILIDPFSKEIGLRPPKIKDDVILVSHNHYDHADTSDASPETIIIKNPGEYEVKGAYIEGIQSFHDNSGGSERGLNIIFIIRFDGMKVCHMGDFGQNDLEGHQLEKIGNVDILLLPVGGTYTIDGKQAVRLVRKIEPKIVIPMHYSVPDLKLGIAKVDGFLKEIGLTPEKVEKSYRIQKKNLPIEEIKLVVFNS